MKRPRSTAGFTLMELLVVLAILGVVSSIGVGAFFNITGAWRLSTFRMDLGDNAKAGLDAIGADVGHVVASRHTGHAIRGMDVLNEDVKYQGMVRLEDDRLILPVARRNRDGNTERMAVRYHVEREAEPGFILYRTLGALDGAEPAGARQEIARGVLTFEVEYLHDGTWHDGWDASHHPDGIRVSLTVQGLPSRPREQISRSAFFPIHVK